MVCQFVAYRPEQVQRDYRLFTGRTKQYIFISSAAAYHRPTTDYRITEGTSLANPYWAYARDKAACEAFLMQMYRENDFPVTIVRPSHTYGDQYVPVGAHGRKGNWQILRRMLDGKPVGDVVMPSAQNQWKHTWTGLHPSEKYTVEELNVPVGYTSEITKENDRTFLIVNTAVKSAADLPKTGDPFQLYGVLSLLLVSGTGIVLMSVKRKKHSA